MRKRSIRKQLAKAKRILREKDRELARWEKRRLRLVELIRAVKENKTMQDSTWVEGQSRHFEKLLANHLKTKPKE